MKVKPKKDSTKMFPTDHVSHGSHKGRQKESGFTDRKGDAAVALITSSSRKRMIDSGSSCLVSPTQPYTRSKGTKACLQSNDLAEDVCRDLRLAFSTIDGLPADQNGGSVAASQSCILETIFSPVFHLFKGLSGEISTSCTSSVDQADSPEEKSEAVDTTEDCKSVCREISKKLSASCPTATTVTEEVILEKEIGSVPRILDEVPLLSQVEHVTIPTRAPDDEMFGTQTAFDVGDDCIAWSLLDENVARDTSQQAECMEEGLLDSDGASLYLAIQQTKPLECNDENIQSGAAPDEDEFNDFDPYLFIKHLPDLSEVVSPSRPMLLPKQTRRCPPITLVLDLDETLVHSTLEHCEDADFTFPVNFNFQEHTVYVRRRPHLQKFMERVAQMFEIIVFTASQSIYAEQLLNVLDPKRKLIRHRVFRDSCVFVEGNYLKDLTVLGRDLSKVAIVDNSPQAFGFQVDNGIPIESWFDDRSDSALSGLLPFLETLVGVDDVRPIIAKKFNLRQKIAAAMDPGSIANRGDPFERCL